jgi:hypothetical protein
MPLLLFELPLEPPKLLEPLDPPLLDPPPLVPPLRDVFEPPVFPLPRDPGLLVSRFWSSSSSSTFIDPPRLRLLLRKPRARIEAVK